MVDKIVLLGAGYVGLPLSVILAKTGYEVVVVDVKKEFLDAINSGESPIKEKYIEESLVQEKVKRNLVACEEPCSADVFFICVQTPVENKRKSVDVSYVISSIKSIIPFLRKGNLIIIESTVPPYTCRKVIRPLIEESTGLDVGQDILLAHCPERILPGNAFYELVHNDRVIGGITRESACMAKEIYDSFVEGRIDMVDDLTAEVVKLVENTFRDVNIALANEFSLIAETLGVDVEEVIRLANKHPRVNVLSPGIGVGGHCLPKDPWLLIQVDPKNASLILEARRINESMPEKVSSKIRRALKDMRNPKIVALGMTYKPDSDDLRESPALKIIETLRGEGYDITGYDNFVKGHTYESIGNIAKDADCIAVLVEHTEIKEELEEFSKEIRSVMRNPIILRIGSRYKPDIYDLRQRGISAGDQE